MNQYAGIDPRGLVARYMAHRRLWGAPDQDDVLSDAMYAITCAVKTWRDGAGRSLLSWCWLHMDQEVALGRKRRARHYSRHVYLEDAPDIDRWRIAVSDPAFKQIEDRVYLQRLADMAHLTDKQADAIAWMAVHGGTRGAGGLPGVGGNSSHYRGGLAKLRRVATTGRPWTYTRVIPSRRIATDDACAHGHPWTEETRYVRLSGVWVCRTCRNERRRAAA
jgi:hypothetical protein